MEDDIEGQPDGISSSNGSFVEKESNKNVIFREERKVKESSEINEKDIAIEPEGNDDLKKEESENSLDLTRNKPSSESSLETIEYHAKTESGMSGNEEVENHRSETYIAGENNVAGDIRKVCEDCDEPNTTNKVVDKIQKDIIDKGCVTDESKNFEIDSIIMNAEPKSPEIGFRKKSLGQISPFSSPVKSPQMTEKSVIKSPELGGRRKLKVHVFDTELATAGDVTSRQENVTAGDVTSRQEKATADDVTSRQEKSTAGDVSSRQENVTPGDVTSRQEKATTGDVTSRQEKATAGDVISGQEKATAGDVSSGQEKANAGDVTSRQEKSSERKDSESVVEEGTEETPTCSGEEKVTKVRESASLLVHNAETTSPCLHKIEEPPVCKISKDSYLCVKENIDNIKKQSPSSEDICKKNENVSEKGEGSIVSLDHNTSAVDKDEKELSVTEKVENIITSLGETKPATCVNTDVHDIIKPEDGVKDSHDKKEEYVESNAFLNDESESSSDISNENNYDEHIQKASSRDGTIEGKSFEDESSCRSKELMNSKEYPTVEKVNCLEVNQNSVKENDEFSEAQHKVDNGNTTDLGITEKKILLLNECQNKSDPSNRSECREDFTENQNFEKVERPLDGDAVDIKTKVSVCEKESGVKEINKSGDAPAESEYMDKEFHKLSEIGKLSDEDNSCKKLDKTKSLDSNHSVRQYSQEGEEELIDCPQLSENRIACEVNDPEEHLDHKEREPGVNKCEVSNPKDDLSLSERKSMLKQKTNAVGMEDKEGRIDSVSGKKEEKATGDEKIKGDNKKVRINESDQCSDSNSTGSLINKTDSFKEMRTYGREDSTPCVDTGKTDLLTKSDTFEYPDEDQSSLPATSDNETLQATGDTQEEEGSDNTKHTKNKKRLRDSDSGKFLSASKPKHSRVSLDTQKYNDHNRKSDEEASSSGTLPIDTRIECVDISNEEERKLNRQRGNVVDMVCKKCRDIWNDEVLRIIFKGTESVTVNSKITYGAIVCINNWINRNISGDKEEAITQVFERTDLGSNIAQLNISRLDEWLEELLQKGKNRCCKVFTAVYQPGKDIESHKTKAAANMPKAVQATQSNVDTKNQNSVVSKEKKSLATKSKGPLNAKSPSPTGIKSQSPVANRGQCPVIARCQGLPKGRVYLVPAPAVASVLPSALTSKSIPSEESAVLPKSASSLMKPCKIILKNPVRLGPNGSNQNLNNASDTSRVPAVSKLHPSGSSIGLTSEENTKVVSSKSASNNNSSKITAPVSSPSIYQSSLKARNSKSTKATVADKAINNKEYHQHKVMSGKKSDKKGIIRKNEHEGVKSPATGVEPGISSKDPAIREMLKALNLDIEDFNIYSSYCSKPVTNKMKFECPSEQDKTSPCYLSMLKERSALNGNALIAFDLLLYESNNHHTIASYGSTKSRFVTKRELLTLQSIFILNPETPDISLFYEVFIQILLSRKKVLLIPDSHTFLVVTENIRKEYNREKSKDLSIQILNENWDPYNICSADDVWLEGQNPEEVTNRDVISIFCTWRNLEKNPSDQSLCKALHAIWQFHNVKNGDYFGICFRLYTKFIRIVYEEKDLELAKVFLDEPFSGGFCIASKKFLQNLINSNKQKINLLSCDDEEEFKCVLERCEELEKMAHETLTAPILRDLCAQVAIVQEKIKESMDSHEVLGKRITDLLGKREKLLREIKGSEAKKLVQSMRAKISELHKAAQKRRQEYCSSERSAKRRKRYSDMNGSDMDPSCKDISPHIKELIKDLLSKGVQPDKIRHVIGIVSGITKEEMMLKIPSEKWILSFAQMNS